MATLAEIQAFRLVIDEPTPDTYSDQLLSDRLDAAAGETDSLAADIWLEKAARYARLVDMQEGTSRRSLSQMQSQALAMHKQFSEGSEDDGSGNPGGARRTTTRAIERI